MLIFCAFHGSFLAIFVLVHAILMSGVPVAAVLSGSIPSEAYRLRGRRPDVPTLRPCVGATRLRPGCGIP